MSTAKILTKSGKYETGVIEGNLFKVELFN